MCVAKGVYQEHRPSPRGACPAHPQPPLPHPAPAPLSRSMSGRADEGEKVRRASAGAGASAGDSSAGVRAQGTYARERRSIRPRPSPRAARAGRPPAGEQGPPAVFVLSPRSRAAQRAPALDCAWRTNKVFVRTGSLSSNKRESSESAFGHLKIHPRVDHGWRPARQAVRREGCRFVGRAARARVQLLACARRAVPDFAGRCARAVRREGCPHSGTTAACARRAVPDFAGRCARS